MSIFSGIDFDKIPSYVFNPNFLFKGLNYTVASNKYWTMDRVSEDENKIVVKVADEQVFDTKYGYALILDHTRVVFLKIWQVCSSWFGTEVLLNREYFKVKEFGVHKGYSVDDANCDFDTWVKVAKEQSKCDEDGFKINPVKWVR